MVMPSSRAGVQSVDQGSYNDAMRASEAALWARMPRQPTVRKLHGPRQAVEGLGTTMNDGYDVYDNSGRKVGELHPQGAQVAAAILSLPVIIGCGLILAVGFWIHDVSSKGLRWVAQSAVPYDELSITAQAQLRYQDRSLWSDGSDFAMAGSDDDFKIVVTVFNGSGRTAEIDFGTGTHMVLRLTNCRESRRLYHPEEISNRTYEARLSDGGLPQASAVIEPHGQFKMSLGSWLTPVSDDGTDINCADMHGWEGCASSCDIEVRSVRLGVFREFGGEVTLQTDDIQVQKTIDRD